MSGSPGRAVLSNLRRSSTLRHFARSFLTGLGLVSGVCGLGTGLFPDAAKEFGAPVLMAALTVAFGYAVWAAWPRLSFSRDFALPATRISVVVGDLFAQDGHLVIGMSDTFDTELPVLIDHGSVQAQFLVKEFAGDTARLDAELTAALASHPVVGTETREAKPLGKLDRYPLGTVAVLGTEQRRYYGVAYSRMRNDYVCDSSVSHLWNALMELWPVVRNTAHLGTVSITAVGLGLARLSGRISQADVVRLIIISYLTSSRDSVVAGHLRIVLAPGAAEQIDLRRLSEYLDAQ
ncbi:macro domain-containing protein [Streptomyces sp. NPDC005526]|uniref:macro domain-containing protein n=1 Tax=Streptomyces sp. NPDC005526 TaxID=3156885 RepID=UPI0033B69EC2